MMTDHALKDSLKARAEHMDQPRCPIGIFHERNWDIGKDFERIVEVGRGKDTIIYKAFCKRLQNVSTDVSVGDIPEAEQQGLEVAIKVYERGKVSSTKLRAIKREIAMMRYFASRKVPNTVQIFTAFADEFNYYIVMEYCPGGDLLEWILDRKKAMHEVDALRRIGVPLLDTLCHLHSLQIIHRDLKLENIFLDKDGKVKLGDFGLTMCRLQESAISPVGTVEYMAPEVVLLPPVEKIVQRQIKPQDIHPTDEKVDIWALGVTLYELVTGKLPFVGKGKQAIKDAILNYNIGSFPSCVSVECQNIILDMMQYRSEDRPSAFTLRRRITKLLQRRDHATPCDPVRHVSEASETVEIVPHSENPQEPPLKADVFIHGSAHHGGAHIPKGTEDDATPMCGSDIVVQHSVLEAPNEPHEKGDDEDRLVSNPQRQVTPLSRMSLLRRLSRRDATPTSQVLKEKDSSNSEGSLKKAVQKIFLC
mmetsp:Transcript_6896/g.13734  ORF Transcript_6896/g.13734 Transcript_6896/m.13734 type:complete len:477 (+) Transcript_6896:465-1895(+)